MRVLSTPHGAVMVGLVLASEVWFRILVYQREIVRGNQQVDDVKFEFCILCFWRLSFIKVQRRRSIV